MNRPPPITRFGAQRAAHHELSKPIYHRSTEPLATRAIDALGRYINNALGSMLDRLPAGSGGALAFVVIILVLWAVVLWRVGVPRRAAAAGAILAPGTTISADEHRARSERAAAVGDWHAAVVERMRATAREVEQRGILEPRAGRTASELARDAGAVIAAAAGDLSRAANAFNHVVYGSGVATQETLAVMINADDAVRRSARSVAVAR